MRAPKRETASGKKMEGGAPNITLPTTPVSAEDDAAHARRLSRVGLALVAALLLFLVFPAVGLYEMRSEPARLVPAFVGTAVFAATYTWAAWRTVRSVSGTAAPLRQPALLATLGGLSALALILAVAYGDNWVGVFGFVGILAGLALRFRAVVLVSVALALLTLATAGTTQVGWGPATSITINAALSGLVAFGVRWLVVTNRELRTARREIARLAVSEERLRLSREIHDTLTQGFAGIVTHLAPVRKALEEGSPAARRQAERHLGQIDRTARDSLSEARRLVWALRPEPLQDAPLPEAIGRLARRFSEESGVPADASVTGMPQPLAPDLEVTLLRTAQEALSNVHKHAGPSLSRVALTLSYLEDAVALDVRDDGVGFDPAQERRSPRDSEYGGMGLTGIRERVEASGGTLSVESSSGEGTTLAVELPVPADGTAKKETP